MNYFFLYSEFKVNSSIKTHLKIVFYKSTNCFTGLLNVFSNFSPGLKKLFQVLIIFLGLLKRYRKARTNVLLNKMFDNNNFFLSVWQTFCGKSRFFYLTNEVCIKFQVFCFISQTQVQSTFSSCSFCRFPSFLASLVLTITKLVVVVIV